MFERAQGVGFLPSLDLDRSQEFFAGRLRLQLVDRSSFACVFDCAGSTLRVTRVDDFRPQPFTVFGWVVDDVRAMVRELVAAGIPMRRFDGLDQDDAGVWSTPTGDLVAWFEDPDRNVLSLTEFADR